MKKFLIAVLGVAVILGGVIYYVQSKTEGVEALVDNYGSKYETKEYYVQVPATNEKMGDNQYRYTFNAYDTNGEKQIVIKIVDKELKPGAYFKIYAKGKQGKGWMEIKENEVPKEILQKVKANV